MTRPNNADISKRFAKNLREVMTALGMNQSTLSERTQLTQACISQILSGQREPLLSTVVKIMEVIPASFERLIK